MLGSDEIGHTDLYRWTCDTKCTKFAVTALALFGTLTDSAAWLHHSAQGMYSWTEQVPKPVFDCK